MTDAPAPTLAHPEEVLDALVAKHPGLSVEIEPGQHGHTLLHLDCASGHRVLTVNEPPEGWPVLVTHHHAHPSVSTTYRRVHHHDPNRSHHDPRHPHGIHPDIKLTAAEWEEWKTRPKHPELDTPERLRELVEFLLAHPETELARGWRARAKRRRQRAELLEQLRREQAAAAVQAPAPAAGEEKPA